MREVYGGEGEKVKVERDDRNRRQLGAYLLQWYEAAGFCRSRLCMHRRKLQADGRMMRLMAAQEIRGQGEQRLPAI